MWWLEWRRRRFVGTSLRSPRYWYRPGRFCESTCCILWRIWTEDYRIAQPVQRRVSLVLDKRVSDALCRLWPILQKTLDSFRKLFLIKNPGRSRRRWYLSLGSRSVHWNLVALPLVLCGRIGEFSFPYRVYQLTVVAVLFDPILQSFAH